MVMVIRLFALELAMYEILIEDDKYWLNGSPKTHEELRDIFENGEYRTKEYKNNQVIETYGTGGYVSRKDGPAMSIYASDGVTLIYPVYLYKNVPYDINAEDLEKEFAIIDMIEIVEK